MEDYHGRWVCVTGRPAVRPAHPGRILRGILQEGNIALAALARHLRVSRQTLYAIVNEERPVSADMAARLSLAFGNSTRFWLNLQANHDAWGADQAAKKMKIGRFELKEGRTGKALVEPMRRSPLRDTVIKPSRARLPVRKVCLSDANQ